jgi:lysozyme
MTEADRLRLRGQLKVDEGFRGSAYQDSEGWWTIGYGRLIDARKGGKISYEEAEYLLANDLKRMERECEKMPAYLDLSPVRQAVLINMCFNLGPAGLRSFRRMFKALSEQDYEEAASHMLESKWASQVGARAMRLAEQMKTGRWAINAQPGPT